jgi:hypothetical protein
MRHEGLVKSVGWIATWVGCLLLAVVPVAQSIYAQGDEVLEIVRRLESADPNVRMTTFYQAAPSALAKDDRLRVAFINLLQREDVAVREGLISDTSDERFGSYFGDLTDFVASLKDSRALSSLIGVIDTGSVAMRGVAENGVAALDQLIRLLASEDWVKRHSAVETLDLMLEPLYFSQIADARSKAKVRDALLLAATDENEFVNVSATDGLAHFRRVDIPGDVNGDLRADCTDVSIVRAAFGRREGQPGFDARADVNIDRLVDVRDLAIVTRSLPAGQTCR